MIPKNLKYGKKLESAGARSYTSYIAPQNGTGTTNGTVAGTETNVGGYTSSNTIIINIPTQRNLVMVPFESYLKFQLMIKNGAAANAYIRLDNSGAHGVIQRLRLYRGSNLLEDLDNYANLASLMMTLQQSADATQGKQNILCGCNSEYVINDTTKVAYPIIAGERLSGYGADIAANAKFCGNTYYISLMSIIGSLGDHYLPLFAMTSAPLRLELQLVSDVLKIVNTEAALANFNVYNVEFVASMIELGDEAMAIVQNNLNGSPLQYVVPQYRNYTYTYALANAVTEVNMPIPAKFSSLKSLFLTIRDKADGLATFYANSTPHFNLSQYRLRIGPEVLPPKAPASHAEFFTELIKAVGSFSDLNHEPLINKVNYTSDSISVANGETEVLTSILAVSNSFALGFDCETYSNANKDSIFSGMNTTTSDIYWTLTHAANASAPTVRYDAYALFDAILVCENGTMAVKY